MKQMNRQSWLKDRAKMFEHTVQVTATDIQVVPTPATAVVSFLQRWESATYRDVGKKQMVIMRDKDNTLKIEREEMLASDVLSPARPIQDNLSNLRMAFVLDHGEGISMVLTDRPDDRWAAGAPEPVSGDPSVVLVPVNKSKVPQKFTQWENRKVHIIGDAGVICSGTLVRFHLRGTMAGVFHPTYTKLGTYQYPEPSSDTAKTLWNLTHFNRGRFLVADVAPTDNQRCHPSGYWARSADLAMPVVVRPTDAGQATRESALQEFRKLADYQEVAAEYQSSEPWENYRGAQPNVQVIEYPALSGKKTLVAVSAISGNLCSQGPFGELFALWEVVEKKFVFKAAHPKYLKIESAADVDGDEYPELFFSPHGYLASDKGQYRSLIVLEIPFVGCPC